MNARDYLTLLRENKLVVLGTVLACLAIAGLVTVLMPRTYASSASYYVTAGTTTLGQQNPASDLYQGAQLAKDRVKSYSELVGSPRVAQDAAARLGDGLSAAQVQQRIGVMAVTDSVILTVTATDRTPEGATRILTAVSDSFTTLVRRLETRPGEDAPQIDVALVQQPSVPATAQSPKPALNIGIGLVVGLLLGFGIAIFRRSSDVVIRSVEDLEYAADAAVLGVVPERSGSARGGPVVPAAGRGAEAESYRRVRTNVEFANVSRARRVLVVTSALPSEGKTTVACNLAAALTAVGARVVLVEGDLRNPAVLSTLGLESASGLTTVVSGETTLDRTLLSGTRVGFDVLPAGPMPFRPNELVSSRRTRGLIDELRSRYDYVVIDTPPVLSITDAVNLGTHADGAILVCRWARTGGPDVRAAVAHLRAVAVPVVGAILCRAAGNAAPNRIREGKYVSSAPGTGPGPVAGPRPVPGVPPTVPVQGARPAPPEPAPPEPALPEPALVGAGPVGDADRAPAPFVPGAIHQNGTSASNGAPATNGLPGHDGHPDTGSVEGTERMPPRPSPRPADPDSAE